MELQLVRRVVIPMINWAALAVANDVDEWEAQFYGRILEVETSLGNLGTAAATTIDVKKNGVSIFPIAPSIAFNAATKRRRDSASALLPVGTVGAAGNLTPTAGEPSGVDFAPGDLFRLDVTAIGTGSSNLKALLSCIVKDV
ncbi:MAG TPA: hypothetical protein VKQ28_16810 [Candidatus Acidoferrum sp.]|nr:hypothetical protein [Candidatus Acidoferrum sp.]